MNFIEKYYNLRSYQIDNRCSCGDFCNEKNKILLLLPYTGKVQECVKEKEKDIVGNNNNNNKQCFEWMSNFDLWGIPPKIDICSFPSFIIIFLTQHFNVCDSLQGHKTFSIINLITSTNLFPLRCFHCVVLLPSMHKVWKLKFLSFLLNSLFYEVFIFFYKLKIMQFSSFFHFTLIYHYFKDLSSIWSVLMLHKKKKTFTR